MIDTRDTTAPDLASQRTTSMPLGVVLRRAPGATRWARVSWTLADVIPFAPGAAGRLLREEGALREVHAATLPLTLHRADAEAYMQGLSARAPLVWCALRRGGEPGAAHGGDDMPQPVAVTVSPFEAQDWGDAAEDVLRSAPMPGPLRAWVEAFAFAHHEEERFVKRRRTPRDDGPAQDGIGDARVAQPADVWRSPGSLRARQDPPRPAGHHDGSRPAGRHDGSRPPGRRDEPRPPGREGAS